MTMNRRTTLAAAVTLVLAALSPVAAQEKVVLHGASQFNESHAFNKTMARFAELVKQYYGKPVEFVMHNNSELGTEREYMNFMARGTSVDFAIIAPGNMTNFAKAAPLMDMPFLFRDREHWRKVTSGDALKPIADEVEKRANVKILGYAGGGERNIVSKRVATTLDELKGLKMRVQGAPVHAKLFGAMGISPSVIAYNETYNAIQSGVVDALENEAAGIDQVKFYEVAPEILMTRHSITVRPLVFSGRTFNRLPADLQAAVLKAGKEAAEFGRQLESSEDEALLKRLQAEGKLRTHAFKDGAKVLEAVAKVKEDYAKEIDALDTLKSIDALR